VKIEKGKEEIEWAKRNFSKAKLRDKRRVRRAEVIAEALAEKAGGSIPQLFENTYDVKAAYNLFRHKESTPDNLQSGHREIVREEIAKAGTYLLPEDTTEMSWFENIEIEGLGPVGNGKNYQGFHLHTVMAVKWQQQQDNKRPPLEVLGVLDQQYHIRKLRPQGEKKSEGRKRKTRELESQLWEWASERIGPTVEIEEVEWIRVCDRGADIYEFLIGCKKLNHKFVVRAKHNRLLINPETNEQSGYLFDKAREISSLGNFQLQLRTRPQQRARIAELSVSATEVKLCSPLRPGKGGGRGKNPPVSCSVVRVWEENPPSPSGVEALEWIILCDRDVKTFEQALEVALQYSSRWIIEEFHKVLKTGLGAERLQLETSNGLFAAISIMSVVAIRLIDLREHMRLFPDSPAQDAGLDALELEVLRLKINKPIETVRDVALAIGRLGGHLNRKSDGMPGWQTLWRGIIRLQNIVEGVRLARNL